MPMDGLEPGRLPNGRVNSDTKKPLRNGRLSEFSSDTYAERTVGRTCRVRLWSQT